MSILDQLQGIRESVNQVAYTPNSSSSSTGLAAYIPTISYGDERPHDVGNDRQLVYNFNEYIDRKSAHQNCFLWSENVTTGLSGVAHTEWQPLFAGPVFLGIDHLSASVTRSLTVEPFWRSYDGTNAWLRATLSRVFPQIGAAVDLGGLSTGPYSNPQYTGEFSQTAEWGANTSTTWATDSAKTLNVGVKDLFFGYAWLVVEGAGAAGCRGLGAMIEGVRVVA